MTGQLRIALLGPLGIEWQGRTIAPGPLRLQALLAVLALKANRVCSVEELFDAVWSDRPPGTGLKVLPPYIYRLRKVLPVDGLLDRTSDGYVLRLPDDTVDVGRFETAVREATKYRESGDLEAAAEAYRQAMELFSGEPLSGLPGQYLAAQRVRLIERRDKVTGDRIDLELERGRHAEVIPELLTITSDRPFDERPAGQLMQALYADGRQAEALDVYTRTRETLIDELGVEPGPALRAVHQQLLQANDRDELPYAGATFVGRAAELAALVEALRPNGDVPAIVAINGMAGAGKTALAVQAARQSASAYPDGRLFVDLHGYTAGRSPLDLKAALDHLLTSVGVKPQGIPQSFEAGVALWRSTTAGQRLLIVLDNAPDSRSVEQLLPGSPTCGVLITSRRQLTRLDLKRQVSLGVLDAEDGLALLTELIGTDRTAADPAATAELIERCGNLPLAIRIAGARLRHRPAWTVAHINDRLAGTGRRLTELSADGLGVATAFELSYEHLDADQQRMFRLLSLLPGRDIDQYGAAALAGITPDQASDLAESLVDASLLLQPTPDRYQFHDLLRDYAGDLARSSETPADLDAAAERLLEYYLQVSNHPLSSLAGMRYVDPGSRPPVALPQLDTAEKSLAWADAEATNLAAAVERAAADGRDDYTLLLALGCVGYLYHRGHVQQIAKVLELATETTRRIADTEAEARVLTATAHVLRGRQGNRASIEVLREALDLLTADSSRQLRAQILAALGYKLISIDPYGEALASLEESTRLARAVNDDRTLAMSLTYAGLLHSNALDNDNALRCLTEALEVFDGLGPIPLKADALCCVSSVHYRLEQAPEAIATATAAYDLAVHFNNRFSKSQALANLGAAHRLGGDLAKAVEVHRKALAASKFSGSIASTWAAHLNLGDSLLELGDFENAKAEFDEVFRPATEDKDNMFLMLSLEGLAGSAAGLGEKERAVELLRQAIVIADEHVPNYAAQFRDKLAALAV